MSQRSITSFFKRLSDGNENAPLSTGKKNESEPKKAKTTPKIVEKTPKSTITSTPEDKKRKSSWNKSIDNESDDGSQKKKRKKNAIQSDSSDDEGNAKVDEKVTEKMSEKKEKSLNAIQSDSSGDEGNAKVDEKVTEKMSEKKEKSPNAIQSYSSGDEGNAKVDEKVTEKMSEKREKSLNATQSDSSGDEGNAKVDPKVTEKMSEKREKSLNATQSDSSGDEGNAKVDEKVTEKMSAKKEKSPEKIEKSTVRDELKNIKNNEEKGNKTALKSLFAPKSKSESSNSKKYDPTLSKYDPISDATWQHGETVPYSALSRTLEEIEAVSARLKIIEILSNFFRSVIVLSPDDLLPSLYLCLNQLAPAYEGIELGIAEMSLMKAIAQSTGRTIAQIKVDAQNAGDLGIVAEQSKSKQRMIFQPQPLIVKNVFAKLKEIAKMTGHSSQSKKVEKIQTMFVACKDSEARFLIRSLAGKLRIGLAEQSVLQALALACTKTPPNQKYSPKILNASKGHSADSFKAKVDKKALILKTTYCECPNYDLIIPVLLSVGIDKLPEHCKLTPGIPLRPMLAHPTKGVQEVLERFDGLKFTCEWKYDGERAQIHISEDGSVSIYSRNQENTTSKYPDIVNRLSNCKSDAVRSCVLDCEAVAWNRETKQIMPFQILSTRKRKDANEANIKVQVCVFMFDLLYLNGTPLVKKPFVERRQLLKEHFKESEDEWCFATSLDTQTMEEVQEFLEESVRANCEGLMVKTLEEDATYEIAKRSRNWLKLKKDYLEGVGDTLDVVVIGGYLGKGKRTGTYGGFLLACYDPDNEEYQTICKIGTGFTDESLQTHTDFFNEHKIAEAKRYYRYDSSLEPDHWFNAVQVWEIKCADLSISPVHSAAAGIVDPEKGVSLRFPRFIRIREDKGVEDATSAQQVAKMYNSQDQIKNAIGGAKKGPAEEDFY